MSVVHRFLPILLLFPAVAAADPPVIGHDLSVRIDDGTRSFTARDRIVVIQPDTMDGLGVPSLSMGSGLRVDALAFDGEPVEIDAWYENTNIDVPPGTVQVDISYGGKVDESQWPYIVWLPGDGWYPEAKGNRLRFRLTVAVPRGWRSLSQGVPDRDGSSEVRTWVQEDPQQGIYLVTGPWHAYTKQAGVHRAGVMLIEEDDELADTYLDATLEYLGAYSNAIGAYPYHGFTLVENARQTGWGMPGFTLLGSRIIRLPFIPYTSFPHEILHNWWGNGVFVDRGQGNWSEGLTTYLSDYLSRERRGKGRQYRLNALISWQDYTARGADFPLSRFTARHDRATQAVGYGKSMFFFHMLRRELGDDAFLSGLREFFGRFKYRHADFGDIRRTFERTCDCALDGFFSQWLGREGAPALQLSSAVPGTVHGQHSLTAVISQSGDDPWLLRVPVRVVDASGDVMTHSVRLGGPEQSFTLELGAAPARVDVDPEIELFRMLDEGERPSTFSQLFAAERVAVSVADGSFADVAESLVERNPKWALTGRPPGETIDAATILLIGWDHPLAMRHFKPRHPGEYNIYDAGMEIAGVRHELDDNKVIVLVDAVEIEGESKTMMWVAARRDAGLQDLMRRLTHYGRFSYAVFDTPEGRAAVTGQWLAGAKSLSRVFDDSVSVEVTPPPRPLF